MMLLTPFGTLLSLFIANAFVAVNGLNLRQSGHNFQVKDAQPLQDIVTWDERSLFVRGERIMIWSGSFHPFRLPVTSLWLDVFQKIKAAGYNCVSFYTAWSLLEGEEGVFRANGIFALDQFFEAATTAGVYLLARPGPYINAESYGGGFPSWIQKLPAVLRTNDTLYVEATQNYVSNIAAIIGKAQITNGGPIILFQPENEFGGESSYMAIVERQFREAGIVLPYLTNEEGLWAPGSGQGAGDIYGFDSYPVGFDCSHPDLWANDSIPTTFLDQVLNLTSTSPFSIVEFQGGSLDVWGGPGNDACVELTDATFERVLWKNNWSFGIAIQNLYMTFGGTNWGYLSWPGGYTSYDYAAIVAEDRTVAREKYSEAKLEANFIQASTSSYLTALPQNNSHANGSYTGNRALFTTALFGNDTSTNFFIVRHAAYNTYQSTKYKITVPTTTGLLTLPQIRGELSLHGRDSKVHVTGYDLAGVVLLYSTAEIFTWKKYGDQRILLVYGGPNETHELAVAGASRARILEGGSQVKLQANGSDLVIINYQTQPERSVVELENGLLVFLLDRESAYDYWVIDLPSNPVSGNFTNQTTFQSAPIVKANYLLRTVIVNEEDRAMHLTGDINATSEVEIIGGAPTALESLTYNGKELAFYRSTCGSYVASVDYVLPIIQLPNLATLVWSSIDSLPEIQPQYDDSLWTVADHTYTNCTARSLTTPVSTYAGDYNYAVGTTVYRGRFTAHGNESRLDLNTQGGTAYGHSIWINDTFIGSNVGNPNDTRLYYGSPGDQMHFFNYTLPAQLSAGQEYVFVVVVANTGLDENYVPFSNWTQRPRGILDWELSGHPKSDIQWKLTGNLGGSSHYHDKVRGPLNEGGLYAERQGYHLPGAPTDDWNKSRKPFDGVDTAGIMFYSTQFNLSMPRGYDVPLSIALTNNTAHNESSYRCDFFVNGYQYGRYVSNIGPQTSFPVPEGIWNYDGENYLALSVWALDQDGAKLEDLRLVAGNPIQSGYGAIVNSPMPRWIKRRGAY